MKHAWLLALSVLLNLVGPIPCFSQAASLSPQALFTEQVYHPQSLPDVRYMPDLSYVPNSKDVHQTLDLYLPTSKEKSLPVIVWIHGGGWSGGDKRDHGPFGAALTAGYAVASINYRLSSNAIFPAQLEDCKAAIRYLRANAQRFGLDERRIGVWGSSAGGHLAALMTTSSGVSKTDGALGILGVSSAVQAGCDWSGPSDLLTIDFHAGPGSAIGLRTTNSPVTQLLGGPVWYRKDLARLASPVTYIRHESPPILVMHGSDDNVVPVAQSLEFFQELQKKGVKSEFGLIRGAKHDIISPQTTKQAIDFFDRYLRKRSG